MIVKKTALTSLFKNSLLKCCKLLVLLTHDKEHQSQLCQQSLFRLV